MWASLFLVKTLRAASMMVEFCTGRAPSRSIAKRTSVRIEPVQWLPGGGSADDCGRNAFSRVGGTEFGGTE